MSKNYYHHQTIYSNRYGYMQENAENNKRSFRARLRGGKVLPSAKEQPSFIPSAGGRKEGPNLLNRPDRTWFRAALTQ